MQRVKIAVVFLLISGFSSLCLAADIEALKIDFLQGNYRRVIFEANEQLSRLNIGNTDELNYILGLSYFKEGDLSLSRESFARILNNKSSKFKNKAGLSLADTYLVSGKFQEAEDIYSQLINESDNNLRAPVLYRLSQLELKKGNSQKSGEYLSRLRKDFPLSTDLRLGRGIQTSSYAAEPLAKETGKYCIQAGFFSNYNNAVRLKDKLIWKNFSAYLEQASGGWRVKVGNFNTQKEALEIEAKLSSEGFQTKLCP